MILCPGPRLIILVTPKKSVERPALPRLQLHAEKEDDAKSKEKVEKSSSVQSSQAYSHLLLNLCPTL